MAISNVSYAAPIASTAATLAPTAGTAAQGATNAAVSTGYDPNPASVIGGGSAAASLAQVNNGVGAQVGASAIDAASQRISALGATPNTSGVTPNAVANAASSVSAGVTNGSTSHQFGAAVTGGGAISDALLSGVAKIAAFAQNGMKSIEQAIQGDMNANNGQVDPAKMQQYTMQMSNYELMNQMAAKLQEKEEAAMRVWLR